VRGWLVAIALGGGACITDPTVACGTQACPAGQVCTPGGCATREDAAACGELVDGDACATATYETGACFGGACHEVVCGDGFVDLHEVCDDHNVADGDGCSSKCDSNETCGNGTIDVVGGEQCDDDTLAGLSNDGCTSSCQLEVGRWDDVSPAGLTRRSAAAIAFDVQRQRVVLFGGISSFGDLDETWEWDGARWLQRHPAVSPPARRLAMMTYDTAHQQVVLFGGRAPGGSLGDTWVWDGSIWTELHPTTSPPARSSGAMTYDAGRGRALLFGGVRDDDARFADTWTWDGTSWTQAAPATSPAERAGHSMTYDVTHDQVVLYGGNVNTSETWLWNGATWKPAAPTTTPAAVTAAALAYDAVVDRVVLFGGVTHTLDSKGHDVETAYDDTYLWNGTNWTIVPRPADATKIPPPRYTASMVYDSVRQQVVLFGGNAPVAEPVGQRDDTWLFAADSTWSRPDTSVTSPPTRRNPAMAYDARHGTVVLYGGTVSAGDVDTWLWSDRSWVRLTTTPKPGARGGHEMVYDGKQILLLGGHVGASPRDDMWSWDGAAWTKLAPSTLPPGRSNFGFAYDAARDRVVLFGGKRAFDPDTESPTAPLADTWEWDGVTWTQLSPPVSPPARDNAAMAYDAIRERVILFGGAAGTTQLADTWSWDGIAWTDVTPAVSPPARATHRLVYDADRRRIVLVGGNSEKPDEWEWDGTRWVERTPQGDLQILLNGGAAYAAIAHQLVAFGGTNTAGDIAGTLAHQWFSSVGLRQQCLLAAEDNDGDGLKGCDDPDCWGRCAPLCPPGTTCDPAAAHCGDGACDPIEDALICPTDCS
jgi:cysteine-rich repeat protein